MLHSWAKIHTFFNLCPLSVLICKFCAKKAKCNALAGHFPDIWQRKPAHPYQEAYVPMPLWLCFFAKSTGLVACGTKLLPTFAAHFGRLVPVGSQLSRFAANVPGVGGDSLGRPQSKVPAGSEARCADIELALWTKGRKSHSS